LCLQLKGSDGSSLEWYSEKDHPRTHFLELASDTGELNARHLGKLCKTLGIALDKSALRRAAEEINYGSRRKSDGIVWDDFQDWARRSHPQVLVMPW